MSLSIDDVWKGDPAVVVDPEEIGRRVLIHGRCEGEIGDFDNLPGRCGEHPINPGKPPPEEDDQQCERAVVPAGRWALGANIRLKSFMSIPSPRGSEDSEQAAQPPIAGRGTPRSPIPVARPPGWVRATYPQVRRRRMDVAVLRGLSARCWVSAVEIRRPLRALLCGRAAGPRRARRGAPSCSLRRAYRLQQSGLLATSCPTHKLTHAPRRGAVPSSMRSG